MASSFSDLGIELMATGENAGTWGTKTNTNLQIVEKAIGGYVEQAVTSGGTTALTITDGDATESTSVARHAVIKLTGTISGNSIVTVPDSIEKVYIVTNGTSGAYTVQFKTASGTGITFGVSEKTTRLVYSDGTNLVDAGFGGSLDVEGRELVLDADGDTSLTADTDDQIDIKVAGSDQIKITDGAIIPSTDNDIDLGTSSLEFKDAFFDGTVTADAFAGPLTGDVTGNVSGTAATVTTAAQSNITSLGTLTTLTVDDITINGSTISDSGDFTVDGGADIILDADGGDIFFKDGGTTFGSATNTSGNLIIKSGTTTALTFSGANVTVAGDLTVSGDDITMGTNTAGNILVADGTNFNSVAVGGLSEISTVADDDVFLAVDTSGGGLKKIARSAVVSGLATSAAISNLADDSTPQLGGNLDMNGNDIVTTSNADLELAPNGTGHVTVRGNTNSGAIQFNCESNSHGQILKAQPHSAAVTNEMLLPDGSSSTLVSLVATQTLTNKTLTTPVIAEIDSGADITLDATADIVIDAAGGNVEFKDAGTLQLTLDMDGTAGAQVIQLGVDSDDLIFKQYDGTTVLTLDDDTTVKVATDLTVGDDLTLLSDSAVLGFGADTDTTLTHTDGTGLTLNSTNKLCFNDASQFIQGTSATVLSIGATDEIDLTATAVDLNGTLNVSGVATFQATPVFPDGSLALADLDIDGGTDISADLTTSDLIIVDDGAGGTNRKAALSRVVTLVSANIDDPTALAIALG